MRNELSSPVVAKLIMASENYI